MKRSLLLVVFVIFSLFIITGCGNLSKYAGTYKLDYYKYVGDPDTAKVKEEWTLVLESNGKGKSNRDGGSYNVEWKVKGNDVTITEKFGSLTNNYNGTINDSRLDIFNGDKTNDMTIEAVFIKQ